MISTYIVKWRTTYGEFGLTLIEASSPRGAGRKLRSLYPMDPSDRIHVVEVKPYTPPGL